MRRFFALGFAALSVLVIVAAMGCTGKKGGGSVAPRNAAPATETDIDLDQVNAMIAGAGAGPLSLVPLREGETLLQTLTTDFDGDGYDDQINALRREGPIILVVGIYDPQINQYRRVDEIETGILYEQSFSYSCMDMTGQHRNALVYSGLAGDGDYIMQIYLVSGRASGVTLAIIGNFRTNGTIFVQQIDRYDAYESGRMTGASYPVWVYDQDAANPDSSDTVQTMYDWSNAAGRYVVVSQRRVTEQRRSSTELARILAGGIDGIGAYLEGIWNQSDSDDDAQRSLYFNYLDKEISFFYEDIQEIYRWERSVVRRNGLYITAVNASMANLQRQVDLNLNGLGELTLRIHDDVRMNIIENSQWNGSFYKATEVLAGDRTKGAAQRRAAFDNFYRALLDKPSWKTPDDTALRFGPAPGALTLNIPGGKTLHGRYVLQNTPGGAILQLRYDTPTTSPFSGSFSAALLGTILELQPVTLRPGTFTFNDTPPIRLE